MAEWITPDRVAAILKTDLSGDPWILELIAQAQGLVEIEVGPQTAPSVGMQAALAQIVARMWRAGEDAKANPPGNQQQTVGPFSFQNNNGGAAGLGLTNREKAAVRKAAGKSGLWVQPTSRGDHLETAPNGARVADLTDPVDILAGAQANMPRPQPRRF
jgi:hypothetical protein